MVLKHIIGLTWIGTTAWGAQYTSKLNKDGTFEVEIPNLGASSGGTWKVDDQGHMCQEYDAGWAHRCTPFEYIDKLPGIVGYTKEGGEKSYMEKSEHSDSFFERRVLGKLSANEKSPDGNKLTPAKDKSGENISANKDNNVASITDRLKALKKLEDAGLISKDEAAAKRQEILKKL